MKVSKVVFIVIVIFIFDIVLFVIVLMMLVDFGRFNLFCVIVVLMCLVFGNMIFVIKRFVGVDMKVVVIR